METKQELLNKIRKIEEEESRAKMEQEKEKNYQKFLNRAEDWVIGKAHCDIGISKIDHNWEYGNFHTIGNAISIHGNCGKSYNSNAQITSSTDIYFHNVWTDKQRKIFQAKLNKVAVKEITKIMDNLWTKLKILGLQSDNFFLSNLYPENKIEEIKREIWKETVLLLDKYKDKDFKELETLYHSNQILKKYLKEKRPNLLKQ